MNLVPGRLLEPTLKRPTQKRGTLRKFPPESGDPITKVLLWPEHFKISIKNKHFKILGNSSWVRTRRCCSPHIPGVRILSNWTQESRCRRRLWKISFVLLYKKYYLPDKSGSADENRQEIDDRRRENCEQSAERNGSLKIQKWETIILFLFTVIQVLAKLTC